MKNYLDMEKFAAAVRAKRGTIKLRDLAKEIGDIGSSTISRVENQKMPDINTFFALCEWLGVPPTMFVENKDPSLQFNVLELITALLIADNGFSQEVTQALIVLIEKSYDNSVPFENYNLKEILENNKANFPKNTPEIIELMIDKRLENNLEDKQDLDDNQNLFCTTIIDNRSSNPKYIRQDLIETD